MAIGNVDETVSDGTQMAAAIGDDSVWHWDTSDLTAPSVLGAYSRPEA
ncbi:MAG: hypothetical protein AAGA42_07060 [Actinomycetota bacterium]